MYCRGTQRPREPLPHTFLISLHYYQYDLLFKLLKLRHFIQNNPGRCYARTSHPGNTNLPLHPSPVFAEGKVYLLVNLTIFG